MNKRLKLVLIIAISLLSTLAHAEAVDGKAKLICAVFEWNECGSGVPCEAVSPEEIRGVRFIDVDFKGKELSSRDPKDKRTTEIQMRHDQDYQIILQGHEYGMAWTMTIDKADGEMTFSGARGNVVFAGFGHCTVD